MNGPSKLDAPISSKQFSGLKFLMPSLHIEDFTRVRVNESDLTAVLVKLVQCQSHLN